MFLLFVPSFYDNLKTSSYYVFNYCFSFKSICFLRSIFQLKMLITLPDMMTKYFILSCISIIKKKIISKKIAHNNLNENNEIEKRSCELNPLHFLMRKIKRSNVQSSTYFCK